MDLITSSSEKGGGGGAYLRGGLNRGFTILFFLNFLSGEEVAKPPEKDFLGETQPLGNATKDKVTTPSAYATFIQAFRSFHESSLQVLLSYWPAVRNGTRDVLSHVGLDSVSIEHFKRSLLHQKNKI